MHAALDFVCNQFELCFKSTLKPDKFVFPLLLSNDMPDENQLGQVNPAVLKYGRAFLCSSEADIFHPSLFARLQMKVVKEKGEQPVLWRNGIACARRSGIAMVVTFEQIDAEGADGTQDAVVVRVGPSVSDVSVAAQTKEIADIKEHLNNLHTMSIQEYLVMP